MAVGADVSFLGDKQLLKIFNTLEGKIQKKALRKAVREVAKTIATRARKLVPVKSGRLKKSIKVRVMKRKARGETAFSINTGDRQTLGIKASDKYFYPAALEFGTSKMKGFHFMKRAADEAKQNYIEVIRKSLNKFLSTLTTTKR